MIAANRRIMTAESVSSRSSGRLLRPTFADA
jgi:hypothetical protein